MQTHHISNSEAETERIAERLGARMKGGEIIELISDLGGGKTTFVRGLARGLKSKDHVHSPSFTIINEYHGPKLNLYHLDFYRLDDPGIVRSMLTEHLHEVDSVIVIEWAQTVSKSLPAERIQLRIIPRGETIRELHFDYPKIQTYLFESET